MAAALCACLVFSPGCSRAPRNLSVREPVLRGPQWQEQALRGYYGHAISLIERAVRNSGRSPDGEILKWLVACYFKNGDWQKAAALLASWQKEPSWNLWSADKEAGALFDLWRIRSGRFDSLTHLLGLKPATGIEWGARGLFLCSVNRTPEAEQAIELAKERSQTGLSRLFLGDWYQADAYLKRRAGRLAAASTSAATAAALVPASHSQLKEALGLQADLLRAAGRRSWNKTVALPAEPVLFDFRQQRIVLTARINSARARLLLDTGATLSALFPGKAGSGLELILRDWPIVTIGRPQRATFAWAKEVRLDDWRLEGVPFALMPEAIAGSEHHGILGTGPLLDHRIALDLAGEQMWVDATNTSQHASGPIYVVGDRVFVLGVASDGRRLRLLLDTGWNASALALFATAAQSLMDLTVGNALLKDLNTQTLARPAAPVEAFQLFGAVEFDGLIGLPAFKGHRLEIDLKACRLLIDRRASP